MCKLTTRVLNLPEKALYSTSRRRPVQIARAVTSYIARTEGDIHRTVIADVLNRDRTSINYYEKTHDKRYSTSKLYRDTFNKIYRAYKDIEDTRKTFLDKNYMKSFLLQ